MSFFLISTYTHKNILAHYPSGTTGDAVYIIKYNETNNLEMFPICDNLINMAFIIKSPINKEDSTYYGVTEQINNNCQLIKFKLDIDNNKLEILLKKNTYGKSSCYINYEQKHNLLHIVSYWNSVICSYTTTFSNPQTSSVIKSKHDDTTSFRPTDVILVKASSGQRCPFAPSSLTEMVRVVSPVSDDTAAKPASERA